MAIGEFAYANNSNRFLASPPLQAQAFAVAGIPYFVTIPGGTPSRCAPGVAHASCTSLAIEDPAHLAR